MAESNETKSENYKGTGRVTSAFGGGAIGSGVGLIASSPSIYYGSKAFKELYEDDFLTEEAEKLAKKAATKHSIITASLIAGIGIIGAILGWRSSVKGEKQFHETETKLAVSQEKLNQLAELGTEQNKRFTDIISSRGPVTEHAAAHAPKDSFAEQAEADKAEPKTHTR